MAPMRKWTSPNPDVWADDLSHKPQQKGQIHREENDQKYEAEDRSQSPEVLGWNVAAAIPDGSWSRGIWRDDSHESGRIKKDQSDWPDRQPLNGKQSRQKHGKQGGCVSRGTRKEIMNDEKNRDQTENECDCGNI